MFDSNRHVCLCRYVTWKSNRIHWGLHDYWCSPFLDEFSNFQTAWIDSVLNFPLLDCLWGLWVLWASWLLFSKFLMLKGVNCFDLTHQRLMKGIINSKWYFPSYFCIAMYTKQLVSCLWSHYLRYINVQIPAMSFLLRLTDFGDSQVPTLLVLLLLFIFVSYYPENSTYYFGYFPQHNRSNLWEWIFHYLLYVTVCF